MSTGSVLITGANGGLGKAFASRFLESPYGKTYHGIYTVRNPSFAQDIQHVLASASKDHHLLPLDLSSLPNVRAAAESLNQRVESGELPPIRALVLNAAVQQVNGKMFTGDGYESHFAINYLANFLFVLLVLKSINREHGRIVMISTALHNSYHWMNKGKFMEGKKEMFTDIEDVARGGDEDVEGDEENDGMRRYATSKMLLVMFMYELQRRLNADSQLSRISVISLDPGGMGGADLTKRGSAVSKFLWGYIMPTVQIMTVYFWPNGVLRTNAKSAGDVLKACFDTKTLGEYPKAVFLNGSKKADSSQESKDEEKQRTLWVGSLKLVHIKRGDTILQNWR